ncbi:MAG: aminotransferase class I/II-fold pyridoxal phosphate-dependent enzyme, partial [Planctomycetes bacterium]|nr:aminotransferase class I/II-fold pyridoxal phosphate-dependent enzyme [Planctomycetota bacterium]
SFAGLGGFICGDERVVSYVKHNSRCLIFAAAMTPASTAAVLKTLELIQSEPEHLANLKKVGQKAREGLRNLGYQIQDGPTPILYIRVGEDLQAFAFWKALFEAGVYTNPVVTPGVPVGWSGVRISFMATHTDEDLAQMFAIFEQVGKAFGLLPASA